MGEDLALAIQCVVASSGFVMGVALGCGIFSAYVTFEKELQDCVAKARGTVKSWCASTNAPQKV